MAVSCGRGYTRWAASTGILLEKKMAIPRALAEKGGVADAQKGPGPPLTQSCVQTRSAVGCVAVLQLVSARTSMSAEARACRRYVWRNCFSESPQRPRILWKRNRILAWGAPRVPRLGRSDLAGAVPWWVVAAVFPCRACMRRFHSACDVCQV